MRQSSAHGNELLKTDTETEMVDREGGADGGREIHSLLLFFLTWGERVHNQVHHTSVCHGSLTDPSLVSELSLVKEDPLFWN